MALDQEIIARLERNAGSRDESDNKELAEATARANDQEMVSALVRLAGSGGKRVNSDAIKVLGEIATRRPELLAPNVAQIADVVARGSGVFVWEGMGVLASTASIAPDAVASHLDVVTRAMAGSSVIARDRGVRALIELSRDPHRHDAMMSVLLDTLETCPVNQLPTYADHVAQAANAFDAERLRTVLKARISEVVQPAKVRRIASVLSKLG